MAASADEREKGTAVTESESESPAAPPLPKEGGLHGWLQVVGTLFILFNIWYAL
jgi:hypothetical protein